MEGARDNSGKYNTGEMKVFFPSARIYIYLYIELHILYYMYYLEQSLQYIHIQRKNTRLEQYKI